MLRELDQHVPSKDQRLVDKELLHRLGVLSLVLLGEEPPLSFCGRDAQVTLSLVIDRIIVPTCVTSSQEWGYICDRLGHADSLLDLGTVLTH